MKKFKLGSTSLEVPAIAVGCMRISKMDKKDILSLVDTAMENDVNFFDHADIYGGGESETVFANAVGMNSTLREKMILQSKCGIRKGFFDFSKDYILNSVDGILKRLNTEYLDILLLHRPDTLMEPDEVASAFETLEKSGKVRHFGVSNQNPMQMKLLNSALKNKIVANQLQFGAAHTGLIDAGINVNMKNDATIVRDGSVLEWCRLHNITIQAWSPMQYGFFEGVFIDSEKYPELNATLEKYATKFNVSKTTIATAWILRHPANMQVVTGTTKPSRLKEMIDASNVNLSREEWYEIYRSAGNILP